ncbi:MAG: S26 family signal peptidase, partial [Gemmataceae bacterium]|nr:S26 family signal peptidase [Gemmataceae bacterium]
LGRHRFARETNGMKRPWAWFLAGVLAALGGCGTGSDASSGDRVLVSKCQYETRLQQPQRYDVVVFKFPRHPFKNNVPTNYIKRLLGLPGEIIAIFFGRLFRFAAPPGTPLPYDDRNDPAVNPVDLWQPQYMHINDKKSTDLFEAGRFEILRKPPAVMLALRRIVYDNDCQAKDMKAFPRWNPSPPNAWTADDRRGFAHAGNNAEQVEWLRYRHLVRPKDGALPDDPKQLRVQLITDVLGYNSYDGRDKERPHFERPHTPPPNWVGDLMLECQVTAAKAEGEFWLELSKGIHRFQARFDLASGLCTLLKNEYRHVVEDGKEVFKLVRQIEMDSKPTRLRGPGTYQVRFANFDARLTLWVDRDLPFGDGKEYPPPEVRNASEGEDETTLDTPALKQRRGPTVNDLEPASIGARGGAVQVHHLRLWRDTYYTLEANSTDVKSREHDPVVDLTNPATWAAYRSMEYKTMFVQPGHYLCLGDNSQASADGRDWGLVPDRLLLGRALLVYYPFHRAGPIR